MSCHVKPRFTTDLSSVFCMLLNTFECLLIQYSVYRGALINVAFIEGIVFEFPIQLNRILSIQYYCQFNIL